MICCIIVNQSVRNYLILRVLWIKETKTSAYIYAFAAVTE